jgi:cysteine-rich repeat protein
MMTSRSRGPFFSLLLLLLLGLCAPGALAADNLSPTKSPNPAQLPGGVCGDGVLDATEQCDDHNTAGGDGCGPGCTFEVCGNGILDYGEICDDGNTADFDGCPHNCVPTACPGAGAPAPAPPPVIVPTCGNLTLEPPEQCDDGNLVSGDGCRSNCTTECCGDGVHDGLEACDDGNTASGDGCSATCKLESCGNGILDPFEPCDDGNTSNNDNCLNDCRVAACGDGFTDQAAPGIETCDDGNASFGDGCRPNCTRELCGDGIVDPQEACDDGNTAGGDGCSPTCKLEACGNGIVDVGEQCDDGNTAGGDGCSPTCKVEGCGNGVVDPGEACDDGNAAIGDGCRPNCTAEVCGDGIVDPQEACDDGNPVSGDGCSSSCSLDGCAADSRLCNDGNPCTADHCVLGSCTHTNNTERCDDGDACTVGDHCDGGSCSGGPDKDCDDGTDCTVDDCNPASGCVHTPVTGACCGNGFIEAGETCDDGNNLPDDGCNPDCTDFVGSPKCVTQSVNPNTLEAGVSVACNSSGITTSNQWLRRFRLYDDYAIQGVFCANTLHYGIQEAVGGVNVTINVYCIPSLIQTPGLVFYANLSLKGSVSFVQADGTLYTTQAAVGGCCNGATEDMVVEVATEDCEATGECTSFIIGANDDGQIGPSYIAATPCGVPTPTDLALLGFPNDHVLMSLCGEAADAGPSCDCCVPDPAGAAGCNKPACQNAVCAIDPFCCSVSWDLVCAGEANTLCACCGGGGIGGNDCDCCDPDPSGAAGCDDATCQNTVCAVDPFCCSVAWDSICAGEANSMCACCASGGVGIGTGTGDGTGGTGCDCCEPDPAGATGCDNPRCQSAVCGVDPFCCSVAWDSICAGEAASQCTCCGAGGAGTGTGGDGGGGCDCCVPDPGGAPGCGDPTCQNLVCSTDPFCCSVAWDSICAGEAATLCACCAGGGTGTGTGGAGCDCCEPDPAGEPGCNNATCQRTVCAVDPFCCSTWWDTICAGEANSLCACCSAGGTGTGGGGCDCCVPDPGGATGCNDATCQGIVCSADPFCCSVAWDSICAGEAKSLCACCSGGGPGCGDGAVDPGERCDDGNTSNNDNCTNECKNAFCGDGFIDQASPGIELCDDGNSSNDDNCTNACKNSKCGDGFLDQAAPGIEECDDGNVTAGDSCGPTCKVEGCGNAFLDPGEKCDPPTTTAPTCCIDHAGPGCSDPSCQSKVCAVYPQCCSGDWTELCSNYARYEKCVATCSGCRDDCTYCGDGVIQPSEQCDDGSTAPWDYCRSNCVDSANCGDCILQSPETCDPPNEHGCNCCTVHESAGCFDLNCSGAVCAIDPSCCSTTWNAACVALASQRAECVPCCLGLCRYDCSWCGDGVLNVGEQCDDGNQINGDGCDACKPTPTNPGVPTSEDFDGDGMPNAVDNCPLTYNPGNGLARFDEVLRALNHQTFGWISPQSVIWVSGSLDHVRDYVTLGSVEVELATTITAQETPEVGHGSYWLVRPNCPNATWWSGGASEVPGARDAALP